MAEKKEQKLKKVLEKRLEDKKLEIPMYDPQTGEPNPHYEVLTGKPNPLLAPKIPSIHFEANKYEGNFDTSLLPPREIEYKRRNRYLIQFPEEIGIQPFFVNHLTLPSLSFEQQSFLGVRFATKKVYSDIEIEIKEIEGASIFKLLREKMDSGKPFKFNVEFLSAKNIVIDKWEINGFISSLSMSTLTYKSDGFLICTAGIKVNSLDLKI